ncbi:MAG: hypothetical protein HEP70_14345 [Rhodobiaceae bacterium]|nr:hypothetical protein [Rhodobiaceae bacterium]
MGRDLRSSTDVKLMNTGSGRYMVATAFAVWALLLQSFLPVAGAFASDSGNSFLVELCTTAGIQTIAIDGDNEVPERPAQSKTGAGCDVCVGCGCSRGASACAGMAYAPRTPWIVAAWPWSQQSETGAETTSGFRSRAPPAG